jgi:hypothetical protein
MRVLFFFVISLWVVLSTSLPSRAAQIHSSLKDCSRPLIPVDEMLDKKWNFNAANVSLAYGIFAAAAANTYANGIENSLYLPPSSLHNIGWKPLEWQTGTGGHRYTNRFTGLLFDSYTKETTDCVFVILAIRGTDPTSLADWNSNFSWVTNIIPIPNQYGEIDRKFQKVIDYSKSKFKNKTINYIATGHSLGGGLAAHLAKCFDDVSAVVFDSSFVHNALLCKTRKTTILEVYDREEILSRIRAISGQSRKTHINDERLSTYGINPYENKRKDPIKQHSMDAMALSMLRMPLLCEINKEKCYTSKNLIGDNIQLSKTILCDNFDNSVKRVRPEYFDFKDVCIR